MAKSSEEVDKWIEAITQAANTNAISERQSEILGRLRSIGEKEGEEDSSSICDDNNVNGSSHLATAAMNDEPGELYDDVEQGSAATSPPPQPARPSKPAAPLPEDDQETYDDVGGSPPSQPERLSKPAPSLPEEGEMYDDVGALPPPEPIRPPKPAAEVLPVEVEQETYDDVGISSPLSLEPVQPNKAVPEIPPANEEEDEELYDDVGVIEVSPPPQPARPKRPVSEIKPTTEEEEEEFYDDVGTEGRIFIFIIFSKFI